MKFHSLTYPDNLEMSAAAPVDSRKQFIHCPDVQVSRALSRGLAEAMGACETDDSGQAAEMAVTVPGYGTVLARIAGDGPGAVGAAAPVPFPPGDFRQVALEDVLNCDAAEARALVQELACLVDTGQADVDLLTTLARLDRFAESLGRSRNAGTPLADAQVRREALERERDQVLRALDNAGVLAADIRLCRNRVKQASLRRDEMRASLHAAVSAGARQAQEDIARVDDQVGALRGVPLMDSRNAAAVKRKETVVETARLQCACTRQEIEDAHRELENLGEDSAPGAAAPAQRTEVPEELQHEIRVCLKSVTELNARLDEVNKQIEDLDGQLSQTQAKLAALPDFTRIAPNPVDWLNQLSSSLKTAISVKYEEQDTLERLRREINELRVAGAGEALLFADVSNFAQAMQDHEEKRKVLEEKTTAVRDRLHLDRGQRDNYRESLPGLAALGFGCALFLLFILGVYFSMGKAPMLYAAGVLFLAVAYFVAQMVSTRRQIVRLTQRIAEHHADMDLLDTEARQSASYIEKIMTRAGCATARELEARYDRYYENVTQVRGMEEQIRRQEQSLRESEERIPRLFERICATLEQVDEHPDSPDDVERCVGSAIGKSRVYHDTVRRLADLRNRQQGLIGRRRFLEKEMVAQQRQMDGMEKELRAIMRDNGFVDETAYSDINVLLTDYYRYLDTARETLSRRELLARRLRALERRAGEEDALLQRHSEELRAMLEEYGLGGLDEVQPAAENAALLSGLEAERQQLERDLEALLQGHPLEFWETGAAGNVPETPVAEVRKQFARCEEDFEKALREYHALREERRRLFKGLRSLNEITEDLAALDISEGAWRRSLSAAARAMALIEELTALWRVRHGAALAGKAESMLLELGLPARIALDLSPAAGEDGLRLEHDEGVTVPGAVLHLVLRFAAVEVLDLDEAPSALVVDGTLQGNAFPLEPQALFLLLERLTQNRQVVVLSDDATLATAALQAGWPALAV